MATPEPPAADAVALAVAAAEEEEEEGGLEVAAEGEGEGGLEVVVPIGAQKHDPAWKHCLMVRLAGRDRLKCVYCGKHFLGGGIHRFKEHLARRPGNACCCPDVPADVEAVMHRSLDEVAAKKLRKRALAAAMVAVAAASPSPAALPGASPSPSPSASASNGDLASPIHVLPLNQAPRAEETPPLGTGWSGGGAPKRRKKALTVRRAPASAPQAQQQPLQPVTPAQTQPPHQIVMALDAAAPPSLRHVHPAAGSDREQVCMAVGRFLYDAGVPLEAVNSAHFQPMVDAIASMGGRPEVLSYHDFRGCVLKKSLDEVTAQLEYYKGSWTRTGCSVLSDEWATDKGRTLMTFAGLAAGDFRRQMAIRARRTLPPAEWWYMYGGACPNLTRLAVRILSQTCSAKGCDRTRIPFEQLHDQRMNIFERQRMHHLTFVQCNLRLQNRQQYMAKAFDPISADYIDIVDDWVVDRSALFSGPAEQPNWMEISQPFNWTPSAGPGDEFESFIEGVDDEMIQGASRGIQDNDDNEDDCNDESKAPLVGERVGSNLDKPVN